MRITADLVYLPESNNYQVSLHGMLPDSPYSYLLLNMEHPTLSGQDKVFQLTPSGENLYTFDPGLQLSGKWYLTITPPDQIWRLTSEIAFPVESVTLTRSQVKFNTIKNVSITYLFSLWLTCPGRNASCARI